MDSAHQLGLLLDLFDRFEIEVRREHLGGTGSNLCALQGRHIMFLDMDADIATQLDSCASAIAQISQIETTFIAPEVRERIEQIRNMGE